MKRSLYNVFIKFCAKFIRAITLIVPIKNSKTVTLDIISQLKLTQKVNLANGKTIEFNVTSNDSLFRADTFLTKEPETLNWIDNFKKGEILWDIGANIGVYALYAAKNNLSVIAFEPSFANYSLLNRNIIANQVSKNIFAYCLAFSDKKAGTYFNMGDVEEGGACNQIGQVNESFNYSGLGEREIVFNQGAICYTIDDAIAELGFKFPNHIKIDVDGVEPYIIKGARKTLADKRLLSLLIEINEKDVSHMEIVSILKDCDFKFKKFSPSDPTYSYIANYIFYR